MYIIKFLRFKNNRKLIVVVRRSKKIYNVNQVVEVLGKYDFLHKKLVFNIFRFIFWMSKNVFCCGDVLELLLIFNIINVTVKKG